LALTAPQSADTVRLIEVRGGLGAVPGLRLAGVHAGIKKRKTDLALVALGGPHGCAQVITTNDIKAAPLLVSSANLEFEGDAIGAIVINAGCANACTGDRGMHDSLAAARHAATRLRLRPSHIIVAFTGVIGVYLPLESFSTGVDSRPKARVGGDKAAYDAGAASVMYEHITKMAG